MKEDILKQREWIVKALNSSNYKADGTVESLKEIDRFFDEEKKPGGLLDRPKIGYILFGIAAYVGEIAIKEVGGEWIADDNDPEGEVKIAVKLKNGNTIWPGYKVLKRCDYGKEESLYDYMCFICKQEENLKEKQLGKKKESKLSSIMKKTIKRLKSRESTL